MPRAELGPRDALVGYDPPTVEMWREGDLTVVSFGGEHDLVSREGVVAALQAALALDDSDLVVDLADVSFMDAFTVRAMDRCREALGERSRSMALRAPSSSARLVIGLCELAHLVDAGRSTQGNGAVPGRRSRPGPAGGSPQRSAAAPVRANVTCVTPLGEDVASTS